jgi:hypothetical protein
VGRPRCARMRRIARPPVIAANICRREPQRGHFRTSLDQTRIIRSAQLNLGPVEGWFGAAPAVPPPRSRKDGGRGTT